MTTLNRRDFLSVGALGAAGLAANVHAAPADKTDAKNPKFKLGLVTYNLAAAWNLDQLLDVCKATGVSPVEFRTTHKHGVEPALSKEQRQEVKKKCTDAGVAIWGCGTVCEFQSEDAAVVKKNIETCKEFVQLVADLGGRGVKVRPNGIPKGANLDKTLEQIGKALIPCGKAADDAGLEIWVEVHGNTTAHPPNMKTIMQHCGHPKVGVTWNSNKEDLVDGSVEKYFKLLQPWIKSCHINEVYKDASGVYPYRELFCLFRESGYDRVTLCEVGHTVADPEMGKEMLHYYKALWTEFARVKCPCNRREKARPSRHRHAHQTHTRRHTMKRAFALFGIVGLTVLAASLAAGADDEKAGPKDNMPPEGFTALFNGKDLTNWQALVPMRDQNYKKWVALSDTEKAAEQKKANEDLLKHWPVENGILLHDGKGTSLQTAKDYGNIELYVDWKIPPKGDSGIYLRAQPQVQIWDSDTLADNLKEDRGTGSGGLWNNPKGSKGKTPLKKADKPVGEWNTFHIIMKGENVTVFLNGEKVVDDAPLANYWEKGKPLPAKGPIELQHHGDKLWFKNVYIKELP